jgi:hypothetical protein
MKLDTNILLISFILNRYKSFVFISVMLFEEHNKTTERNKTYMKLHVVETVYPSLKTFHVVPVVLISSVTSWLLQVQML